MQKDEAPVGHGVEEPGSQRYSDAILRHTHGGVDRVPDIRGGGVAHIFMDPGDLSGPIQAMDRTRRP